jgi:hypothetical protein
LFPDIDALRVDYAMGIEPANMWFSVPTSTQGFNWYAGTTRLARISGSGVFYIGNSSNFGTGRVNITTLLTSSTGTAGRLCDFYSSDASTQIGSITTSGTATSYNTSSDYRLKENIKLIQNATEQVLRLKPCRFNYIGYEQEVDGFIAHEVQEVVPYAVTGEKDALNEDGSINSQQIDPSKLIALLTASLQELHNIVKAQQVQIDELREQLQNHLLINSATIIS